jgi:hypothetical protein
MILQKLVDGVDLQLPNVYEISMLLLGIILEILIKRSLVNKFVFILVFQKLW